MCVPQEYTLISRIVLIFFSFVRTRHLLNPHSFVKIFQECPEKMLYIADGYSPEISSHINDLLWTGFTNVPGTGVIHPSSKVNKFLGKDRFQHQLLLVSDVK